MKLFFLIVILFAGLAANAQSGSKHTVTLNIQPVFEGNSLSLGKTYISEKEDTVTFDKFKFYISTIKLKCEDGTWYQEKDSYHLIDVENLNTLKIILKDFPGGKINSISFNIGVDSIASVSGALAGELDPMKGMYWAWNSGYINAKLEGVCTSRKKQHAFEFHVGGYISPYYALRTVTLPVNDEEKQQINLNCDAAAWLKDVELKKENSIVIPGPEAIQMADKYSKMFTVLKAL